VNAGVSHENFLDRLKESGILSAEELERALDALSASASAPPPFLERTLVDEGVLTGFQVEAINRSAYTELRIGNYDVLDRLGAGGMGEIANVVAGQAKAMLAETPYRFVFALPPIVVHAKDFRLPSGLDCLMVAFTCDYGEFALQLSLDF
jgi:hypothetical protein